MFTKTVFGLSAASLLLASSASAATMATASTDLHLRAGPGPNYEIQGVIDGEDEVTVIGCLDESNWCEVDYNGQQGWAYGDYLATQLEGEAVALYPNREAVETKVVTYDETAHEEGAAVLGGMGAAVGALAVGGPAAAVVGGIIGSAAGVAVSPEEKTVTYIRENPVEPVFVRGELVEGAQVPGEVASYQVPESDYQYVNLNGRYVLIEPETREITWIADF